MDYNKPDKYKTPIVAAIAVPFCTFMFLVNGDDVNIFIIRLIMNVISILMFLYLAVCLESSKLKSSCSFLTVGLIILILPYLSDLNYVLNGNAPTCERTIVKVEQNWSGPNWLGRDYSVYTEAGPEFVSDTGEGLIPGNKYSIKYLPNTRRIIDINSDLLTQ